MGYNTYYQWIHRLGKCEAKHQEETEQKEDHFNKEDRATRLAPPSGEKKPPMWECFKQEVGNAEGKKAKNEDAGIMADAQQKE